MEKSSINLSFEDYLLLKNKCFIRQSLNADLFILEHIMNINVLCYFTSYLIISNGQKIEYLNGLFENELCELTSNESGICKKVTDCSQEYELYRKNQKNLRICNYSDDPSTSIICCPTNSQNKISISKQNNELDLTHFETCRNEFLKFRKMGVSINHFVNAFSKGIIPKNQENCDFINKDIKNGKFFKISSNLLLYLKNNILNLVKTYM